MTISANFDHASRFVRTTARGEVTLPDIEHHLEEEEEEGSLAYPEIVDARDSTIHLTSSDIRLTVGMLRALRSRHPLGPTAVVVRSDFDYGMARMLSILAEDVCQVEVFRDLPEAESWLLLQPPSS